MQKDSVPLEDIRKYQKLVHAIASSLKRMLPSGISIEDLVMAGNLGLVDALEKFDSNNGASFSTYARHRIRGSIKDEIRKMDFLSRASRDNLNKVEEVLSFYQQNRLPPPTQEEISVRSGLSNKVVATVLRNYGSIRQMPLSEVTRQHNDTKRTIMDLIIEKNELPADILIEKKEKNEALYLALNKLKPSHRRILYLYYFEDLKMHEIASKFGLTDSRISQIISKSTEKLRKELSNQSLFKEELK